MAGAIGGGIVAVIFSALIAVPALYWNDVSSVVVAALLHATLMSAIGALLARWMVSSRGIAPSVVFGAIFLSSYLLATSVAHHWEDLISYRHGLAALLDAGIRFFVAMNLIAFLFALPGTILIVAAAGLGWRALVGRLVLQARARAY